MNDYESNLELSTEALIRKMAGLEARLERVRKRWRFWGLVLVTVTVSWVSVSLVAQGSQGPLTLQALAQRLAALEKRVTSDEASGTNIPGQAENSSGNGAKSSAGQTADALAKRVSALEQEVSALKDHDVPPPSSSSSSSKTGGLGSSVKAPFRIVDTQGRTIFSVESAEKGALFFGTDGAHIAIGPGASGTEALRVYAAGKTLASAGVGLQPEGGGDIWVGRNGESHASMTDLSVAHIGITDKAGNFLSDLTRNPAAGGSLKIANASGQVVSFIDASPKTNEGRAQFTDTGGQPLVMIGAAGNHGEVILTGAEKSILLWEFSLLGIR